MCAWLRPRGYDLDQRGFAAPAVIDALGDDSGNAYDAFDAYAHQPLPCHGGYYGDNSRLRGYHDKR